MSASLLTVKSNSFEGPFDLLLELVRERKLDVTAISIGEITQDFLSYITRVPLEASQKARFLSLAATLLLFKLQQVMPITPTEESEMKELTQRLALYQRYCEAGETLRTTWQKNVLFARAEHVSTSEYPLSVSVFDVHQSMHRLLVQVNATRAPRRHLRPSRMSLQECYATISERLRRLSVTSFEELLPQTDSYTRAVTLLTVMELRRQGSVLLTQPALFMPIIVEST